MDSSVGRRCSKRNSLVFLRPRNGAELVSVGELEPVALSSKILCHSVRVIRDDTLTTSTDNTSDPVTRAKDETEDCVFSVDTGRGEVLCGWETGAVADDREGAEQVKLTIPRDLLIPMPPEIIPGAHDLHQDTKRTSVNNHNVLESIM